MAENVSVSQASLLGIATELRFNIYEYLLISDVNWIVIKDYDDEYTKHGCHARPIPGEDPHLRLPWLNLLRTCTALASELTSYIHDEVAKTSPAASTYILDIHCHASGSVGAITWRSIPCPPKHAKVLIANCDFDRSRARFHGDGGPLPIKRELYQTLNRFLHLGPRLINREPLPLHLHLQRLEVNIKVKGEPAAAPATPADQDPRRDRDSESHKHTMAYRGIAGLMWPLEATGLLSGFVDELKLTNGIVAHSKSVRKVQGASVPKQWSRYGFEWGVGNGLDAEDSKAV